MTKVSSIRRGPNSTSGLQDGWLVALRAYLSVSVTTHFLWEIGHLPFYTLWAAGTFAEKAFAVFHCTAGDMIIAVVSLIMAITLVGNRDWPLQQFPLVGALTLFFGVSYTIFSEWINLVVRKSWAYSDLMPTIPPFGTGLTPLLQWLIIPALALFAAKYAARSARVRSASSGCASTREPSSTNNAN